MCLRWRKGGGVAVTVGRVYEENEGVSAETDYIKELRQKLGEMRFDGCANRVRGFMPDHSKRPASRETAKVISVGPLIILRNLIKLG